MAQGKPAEGAPLGVPGSSQGFWGLGMCMSSQCGGPTSGSIAEVSWRHWATASKGATAPCSCCLTHSLQRLATMGRVLAAGWLLMTAWQDQLHFLAGCSRGSCLLLCAATMPACGGWPQDSWLTLSASHVSDATCCSCVPSYCAGLSDRR